MKPKRTRKTKTAPLIFSAFLLGCICPMTVYAEPESPEMIASAQTIAVSETTFPDESFRQYVSENFDTDKDNFLSVEEIENAVQIDFEWDDSVSDLQGLSIFTNLESLNCAGTSVTELDITHNSNLKELNCSYTELRSLDVGQNTSLEKLECYETLISELDVSQNANLIRLDCNNTPIAELDVTHNPELFALNCEDTSVSELNISQNPKLYEVYITNTPVATMDYSHNPELVHIRISGTKMTTLDVSHNPKLAALYCYGTELQSLDLSNNPEMFEIFCYDSNIESLDVTQFAGLRTLDCHNTKISDLNPSSNMNLVGLNCSDTDLSSLDISKNTLLQRLEYANTSISNLDLSANSQLRYINCSNTTMETLDFSGYTNLEEVYCVNANVKSLKLPATVYGLNCSQNALTELDLSSAEDMWLECTLSPQKRNAYFKVDGQKLTLDLGTIVSDLSKVTVTDSPDYSYDKTTGLVTISNTSITDITYQYSHGYSDAAPMDVTLQVQKQYAVLEGGNQTAAKDKNLVFRIDAAEETFLNLLVDGTEVPKEYYTLSKGSTVVSLKTEFLSTLSEGTHTITFVFSDGISETTFTIPKETAGTPTDTPIPDDTQNTIAPPDKEIPKTGDTSGALFYLLVSVSAAVVIFFKVIKLKSNYQ